MPSNNDFNPSNGDSSSFGQITTNPRWPNITAADQTAIERHLFEEGATIHFERLPIHSGGIITGVPSAVFIIAKVVRMSRAASRPLTASEIDATSEAAAISVRYLSWMHPFTLATTLLCTWYTRKSFSFAFYRPKAFNPLVFPMKRAPILRGTRAVRAWHTVRTLSYLPLFWLFYGIFFSSLTDTTFRARTMRDPRLERILQEIKMNTLGNTPGRMPQRKFPVPGGIGTPDGRYPSNSGNRSTEDDGREPYTSQPENAFSKSSPAARPTWTRNAQSQAPPSQPRDDVSDLFEDDDGSPVSASAQQARNPQGSTAWDRLRQQARSGSAQWTQGDSSGQERGWAQLRQDKTKDIKEVQRNTEGFAYTKEDEEREQKKYEKDQAQKEFDALLEAERRGGSGRR
ncbi:hypothetical protein F4818DRAFT_409508 [Hypoxylon cercidicola]|nr:hypothetical protein F4818DRAFT_409508 [Hypoxylon cercidicola]